MIPWELIDTAPVPGSGNELRLYRRGEEFSIKIDNYELMNSRAHGSEDALAELACARVVGRPGLRVLIGGLGLGYTAAAALKCVGADAGVVVAELVPAVVEWNRKYFGHLAGNPLEDRRITVREVDVAHIMRSETQAYDAIMLDVDNSPDGLTRKENDWLYSPEGVRAAFAALRPGGVLSIWSVSSDRAFTKLLRKTGFEVEEVSARSRGRSGGGKHVIWLARRRG